MRPIRLTACSTILIALVASTGCDSMASNRAAPDDNPSTQRSIDDINADARIKKQDVDQTYRDQSLNIGFRQNLIKEKAAQQDAQIDIDRDKVVQPLKLTLQSTREQEKADKQALDMDTAQKLKDPAAQAADVHADHTKRLAEIERRAQDSITAINAQIEQADSKALQQHAAVAKDRDNRLLDTSMELEADERTARQKRTDIENATIKKLDAVGAASTDRMAREHANDQRTQEADKRITDTIRTEVANDKTLAASSKSVDVTTARGVVQVTGTVPSEADRQAIIALAKKVDGVVRVDNQIAVR